MAFETAEAKLGLLGDMSSDGFPADHVLQREQVVRDMDIARIRALAHRHLDPARMVWLVVGDAQTQLPRLRALGLGEPMRVGPGRPPAEVSGKRRLGRFRARRHRKASTAMLPFEMTPRVLQFLKKLKGTPATGGWEHGLPVAARGCPQLPVAVRDARGGPCTPGPAAAVDHGIEVE